MAYNHRQAVIAAEDHVLQLGRLLEKGSLSDLIHPSHAKPEARWRDAGFVILRNEAEEQESDEKFRRIYTPLARELSGFMYRITDGAMTSVLKNTDYDTFFEPVAQIFADHMVKPRTKGPKPGAKSAPAPAWELLAMRAIVTHAGWPQRAALLDAIRQVESNGNDHAVGDKGQARGASQRTAARCAQCATVNYECPCRACIDPQGRHNARASSCGTWGNSSASTNH